MNETESKSIISVGIDPGKSGGFAILRDGKCVRAKKWGDVEFIAAMQKRAELTTRQLPSLPVANRDMATGQISICYELADGAKSALDAAISEAKEREADRIRKGATDTQ